MVSDPRCHHGFSRDSCSACYLDSRGPATSTVIRERKRPMVDFDIKVDADTADAVRGAARQAGMSISSWIRGVVVDVLEKRAKLALRNHEASRYPKARAKR